MYADQHELESACEANDVARVCELFATRPLNDNDATICSYSTSPDLPLMRSLLEHGADFARYLLLEAPPSLDMVKLFVEFGYDVKAEGHKMLQDFVHDREALDWLIDQGADVSRTDDHRDDKYPLRRLVETRDYSLKVLNITAASGNIELFDHLVSRGADPQHSMALHCASKCPDPENSIPMINHLLDKHHMDIEANNEDFRTTIDSVDTGSPLNLAVQNRNLAAIKHLLKRGANPGGTDINIHRYGTVPFLPALGPLLDAGADPDHELELVNRASPLNEAPKLLMLSADSRSK